MKKQASCDAVVLTCGRCETCLFLRDNNCSS